MTYADVAGALAFDHPVVRLRMNGRQLRELIASGGDAVASEPQALAWFLAR